MPNYLLHLFHCFGVAMMQDFKKYLNVGHCTIHRGVEVAGQELLGYLLENEENLLITELLLDKKEDNRVHALAVANIGVIFGNAL
jgi:hypothetical protein